jgi:hypothetical protein
MFSFFSFCLQPHWWNFTLFYYFDFHLILQSFVSSINMKFSIYGFSLFSVYSFNIAFLIFPFYLLLYSCIPEVFLQIYEDMGVLDFSNMLYSVPLFPF